MEQTEEHVAYRSPATNSLQSEPTTGATLEEVDRLLEGIDVGPSGRKEPFTVEELEERQKFVHARRRHAQLAKAPGCFGSPSYRDDTCEACRNCRFNERCEATTTIYASLLDENFGFSIPGPVMATEAIRAHYLCKHNRSKRRGAATRRRHHVAKMSDPVTMIDKECELRLRALKWAVTNTRGDKQVEQLRGREPDIALAWKARARAVLGHGEGASDAQVARMLVRLCPLRTYTRHHARTDRLLMQKLEKKVHVWARFKREPAA